MASIVPRANGFMAQITKTISGKRRTESKSGFTTEKAARKWAAKREAEIEADIAAGRAPNKRSTKAATLGDAIDAYVDTMRGEMGDTKAQVLRTIRNEYDIANMRCDRITKTNIVAFAKELHQRPGLNSASTVNNYLAHLSSVFTHAPVIGNFPLDAGEFRTAKTSTSHLGLTAKSGERTRRPTLAELDLLMEHFVKATEHNPRTLPMHVVTAFAIFSTRRQAEICRITWEDYDTPDSERTARVLVRDMKHPGDKEGNDTWCELPDPCAAIIAKMPRESDRIFPYNSDTLSARFTRACKFLDIEDLHFHDTRHDGTSRLFEMGRTIPQAASVTGHRTWKSLERYTHIRQSGDKYQGWKWLDAVT